MTHQDREMMLHHTNPDVESHDHDDRHDSDPPSPNGGPPATDPVTTPPATLPATSLSDLSVFRSAYHRYPSTRADALFELTDAALCLDHPTISPLELSVAAEVTAAPTPLSTTAASTTRDYAAFSSLTPTVR